MIAIRGATTVKKDTAEEIKQAVKELLVQIKSENGLNDGEIVCILFSNTDDIRSFYPAKAAREAGFFGAPLFSSLEPNIEGSLEKCIRVMLLAETDKKPRHIYLNGAVALRKDLTRVFNIAIDGPAGSGKSTVAKRIAETFDILCLDTGAMYRACALKCFRKKVDIRNAEAVAVVMADTDINVKHSGGVQHTFLDGEDVSGEIRRNEISMGASTVSAHACVREKMVELQRKIAKNTSCVVDGRDIGTNVLPNAEFKFFLTASSEVRAKRRADENVLKGIESDYKTILEEIIKRDGQDKNRKIAPLKVAADAVEVDTSHMNIDEVVALLVSKIQEKI
ncbi:MAG: (d)CMP kinase [Clostridia bacterium]|nr:(d)CMP kinase [Clostridia bacterium]